MDLTTNYGFGKPLPGEGYDIDVFNDNMDNVDATIKATKDGFQSLPKPVKLNGSNVSMAAGALAYTTTGRSLDITCVKACMVCIEFGGNMNVTGSAQADYYTKVLGSGATTFDSDTLANAFTFIRAYGTENIYMSQLDSFYTVLSPGTTTVTMWANHTSAATTHSINSPHIRITPIGWAENYIGGGV